MFFLISEFFRCSYFYAPVFLSLCLYVFLNKPSPLICSQGADSAAGLHTLPVEHLKAKAQSKSAALTILHCLVFKELENIFIYLFAFCSNIIYLDLFRTVFLLFSLFVFALRAAETMQLLNCCINSKKSDKSGR